MNQSLELHDSVVSDVRVAGSSIIVSFSGAYIHRSNGEPGVSPGEGFIQSAELVFAQASSPSDLRSACGAISEGHIAMGEQQLCLLPLPFAAPAAITAELIFSSGHSLRVFASSATCNASGNPRFVERFSG